MRMIRHALTEAVYDWADDGVGPIRVIDRTGRENSDFRSDVRERTQVAG